MGGFSEYVAAPVIVVLTLLLLLGLALGAVVGRRYALGRDLVSFDCALRKHPTGKPGGWILGVARYSGENLEWFRVFTLTLRPRRVLERGRLEVVERREPTDTELDSILPDSVVVRCRYGSDADREIIEFAMSEQAYNGFATWLESAPPGFASYTR
ncbi:DUF2550 domain-containing protein [Spongisporangium articulatum]|uniref:DUF2550 domain-containing protein n=1 Tax=Spongisporangium articulatum TaxID=3362603 RepID=A0ABW8ATE7_9ACTN